MVSPVLKGGAVSVDAYFPAGNWFSLFNYSDSLSLTKGQHINLDAPSDHINVHIRGANTVAMQDQTLTTRTARGTPFKLLVAVSRTVNSTGEVSLDDGEEVEMGREGGKWTLVQSNRNMFGNTVLVESKVVNGEFALSDKWMLEKGTFLGLSNYVEIKNHEVQINSGGNWIKNSMGKASSKISGQFTIVELTGMAMLMGNEFKFKAGVWFVERLLQENKALYSILLQ